MRGVDHLKLGKRAYLTALIVSEFSRYLRLMEMLAETKEVISEKEGT
jgi:hypothetical protein